jgi:hypothetical protein
VIDPWAFVLLSLAAFRVVHLIAFDAITERARTWWWLKFPYEGMPHQKATGEVYGHEGTFLGDVITCAWCLGMWVSIAAYGMWEFWPEVTVRLSIFMAISTVIGLLREWE